jgi:hypothetical protein
MGHQFYYQLCEGDSQFTHRFNALVDLEVLERNLHLMLA